MTAGHVNAGDRIEIPRTGNISYGSVAVMGVVRVRPNTGMRVLRPAIVTISHVKIALMFMVEGIAILTRMIMGGERDRPVAIMRVRGIRVITGMVVLKSAIVTISHVKIALMFMVEGIAILTRMIMSCERYGPT
jgi:hypothetical protein